MAKYPGWSIHHIYWPHAWYKKCCQTCRIWRSIPCNLMLVRPEEHMPRFHIQMPPPERVTDHARMREEIADFLAGRCGCSHHEKKGYKLYPQPVIQGV